MGFLQGALVILVFLQRLQFRSFGKWVWILFVPDTILLTGSEADSWEELAGASVCSGTLSSTRFSVNSSNHSGRSCNGFRVPARCPHFIFGFAVFCWFWRQVSLCLPAGRNVETTESCGNDAGDVGVDELEEPVDKSGTMIDTQFSRVAKDSSVIFYELWFLTTEPHIGISVICTEFFQVRELPVYLRQALLSRINPIPLTYTVASSFVCTSPLTVTTVVGLFRNPQRFPLRLSSNPFLPSMCIDAPESTKNYLSSGFIADDAGRHQTSAGEKKVAWSSSLSFRALLASLPASPRAHRSCLSVSSWDLSSKFGAWGLCSWGSAEQITPSGGSLLSRMFAWRSAAFENWTHRTQITKLWGQKWEDWKRSSG